VQFILNLVLVTEGISIEKDERNKSQNPVKTNSVKLLCSTTGPNPDIHFRSLSLIGDQPEVDETDNKNTTI
jgi:hypothetical protein